MLASRPAFDSLLVADVGGTHARVGLAGIAEEVTIRDVRTYACAGHSSLAAILHDYIARLRSDVPALELQGAVVAIAGFLEGDRLVNANLPWPVSVRKTAEAAGLRTLRIINDFEAVACAIPSVPRDALASLTGAGGDPGLVAPALVIGPGTGLGAALCLDRDGHEVLLTEVGHAALAPYDALQLEVVRVQSRRWDHVDNERVLSGTGIVNLYEALAAIRGVPVRFRRADEIVQAAARGGDPLSRETVDVFCGWLGDLLGDLAVMFGARQVYLAGGVTTHIAPFLDGGRFGDRFADRMVKSGRAPASAWRLDHGELGLLGAALRYRAGLACPPIPHSKETT